MTAKMSHSDHTKRYPNMGEAIQDFEKTPEFLQNSLLADYKKDLDRAEESKPPESFLSHPEWKLVDRVAFQTRITGGSWTNSQNASFESLFVTAFTRLGSHANAKLRAQVITQCLALPRSGTTLSGGCLDATALGMPGLEKDDIGIPDNWCPIPIAHLLVDVNHPRFKNFLLEEMSTKNSDDFIEFIRHVLWYFIAAHPVLQSLVGWNLSAKQTKGILIFKALPESIAREGINPVLQYGCARCLRHLTNLRLRPSEIECHVDDRGRPILKIGTFARQPVSVKDEFHDFKKLFPSVPDQKSLDNVLKQLESQVKDYKKWLDIEELRICEWTRMRAEANALLTILHQLEPADLGEFKEKYTKVSLFGSLGLRDSDHIRERIFEGYFEGKKKTSSPLSFHELLCQEDRYPGTEERLRSLAQSGDRNAVFQLGKFLLLYGKKEQGVQVLMKMFEKGDIRARKMLFNYFQQDERASKEERVKFFMRWRLTAEESEMNDYRQAVGEILKDIKNRPSS
jgi:hypothetical protein